MKPEIKGWCPGALRPMQSGDGWIVRIRPREGRLSPAQARGIAGLAEAHGNGLIDLSSRANLQLRGIPEASYPDLIRGLEALGLVDRDERAETARNIILSPYWTPGDGTREMARALGAAVLCAPRLPGKFGYAIDPGPAPVLAEAPADIRLETGDGGWIVRADGSARGARVTPANAVETMIELAVWFVNSGGIVKDRGRMATFLEHGAVLPSRFTEAAALPAARGHAEPGLVPQGALVGFEFGQIPSQTLATISDLGALRMTPWRMILIEDAREMPVGAEMITKAGDPRSRVAACPGAPACGQAHQAIRPLAKRLAERLPHPATLHVSGCAKGCAHPRSATTTLVGTPEGFDLVRGGKASDAPAGRGLRAEDLLQSADLWSEVF